MATRRNPYGGTSEDVGMGDNLFTRQTAGAAGGYTNPTGNTGYSGGTSQTGTNVQGPEGAPPPAPTAPPVVSPPIVEPTSQQRTYAPIQGFDFDKITGAKPYDSPDKYSDALRSFSGYLGGGGQASRNSLQGAVDQAIKDGFTNARVVGDDKIDFGDGNGPIDVINSKGEIWFQNGADRFGPQGGSPAPTDSFKSLLGALGGSNGPSGGGIPTPPPSDPRGGGGMTPQEAAAAGLGWVPANSPLYGTPGFVGPNDKGATQVEENPGIQDATGGGGGSVGDQTGSDKSLKSLLDAMLQGNLNQDVIRRRTDSARDILQKDRASQSDTLNAALADRGQLGSGAAAEATGRLERGLGDEFGRTINDIFANEGQAADQRFMQALLTSADLDKATKDRVVAMINAKANEQNAGTNATKVGNDFEIDKLRLALDQMLGQGNLDLGWANNKNNAQAISNDFFLGNQGQHLDWDKFQNTFGLQQDQFGEQQSQNAWDRLLQILALQKGGVDTSAGGHI